MPPRLRREASSPIPNAVLAFGTVTKVSKAALSVG